MMETFVFAPIQAVLLFIAGGGNIPNDLVSLIDARDYFKVHEIAMKPDTLLRLAGKAPQDGPSSIVQLLAIRWLGEHPDEVKKARDGHNILRQIAEGARGKDSLGFARDYARRALARMDGKELPIHLLPANSLRADALSWFPRQSSIFGGLDLRPAKGKKVVEDDTLRILVYKMMIDRERQQLYEIANQLGNIRIDRIAFAIIPDVRQYKETRVFVRVTGLADRQRLAGFIKKNLRKGEMKDQKTSDGKPITVVDLNTDGPAMAFIGNTDLMVAGFARGDERQDHIRLIEEMLKIRAGTKPSLVKGPYAGALKNSPAQAIGLLIGKLPDHWRAELAGRPYGIFRALPRDFNLNCTTMAQGVSFRFTGSSANAREAKAFVEGVDQARQQALGGLKKLPYYIKLTSKQTDLLRVALKGIHVEAQDALLSGKATISNEALKALHDLIRAGLQGLKGLEREKPKAEDTKRKD